MTGKLSETEEKALQAFKERLLLRFGENIKEIRLFGSKARGDFHAHSDIDVCVLIEAGDFKVKDQIVDTSWEVLMQYDVYLSTRVITAEHFSYLKYLGVSLVKNLEKEGIPI